MEENPNERVDNKALVNAIIWTGLVLGALALTLIVVNILQANEAAKKANAAPGPSRANGSAPIPDLPGVADREDIAEAS